MRVFRKIFQDIIYGVPSGEILNNKELSELDDKMDEWRSSCNCKQRIANEGYLEGLNKVLKDKLNTEYGGIIIDKLGNEKIIDGVNYLNLGNYGENAVFILKDPSGELIRGGYLMKKDLTKEEYKALWDFNCLYSEVFY